MKVISSSLFMHSRLTYIPLITAKVWEPRIYDYEKKKYTKMTREKAREARDSPGAWLGSIEEGLAVAKEGLAVAKEVLCNRVCDVSTRKTSTVPVNRLMICVPRKECTNA